MKSVASDDGSESVPPELDEQLRVAREGAARLRRVLAGDPELHPDAAQVLSKDSDKGVRRALATNASTPNDVLRRLRLDDDAQVRRNATVRPGDGDAELATAAEVSVEAARWIAELGAALSDDLFDKLRVHPDPRPREELALAPQPAERLSVLAGDPSPRVRAAVAGLVTCPPGVLERLAEDPIARVRAAAAGHTGTPTAALLRLASDRSSNVRWWLLMNPAARSPEILAVLSRDPDQRNRETALDYCNGTKPSAGRDGPADLPRRRPLDR